MAFMISSIFSQSLILPSTVSFSVDMAAELVYVRWKQGNRITNSKLVNICKLEVCVLITEIPHDKGIG